MKKLLTLTFIFLLSSCAFARRERPARKKYQNNFSRFSSDGCSAYPDMNHFYGDNTWIHCCVAHDIAYYIGGTYKDKQIADESLEQCVAEESFALHGTLMKWGVMIGGTPKIKTSWRWGYGWENTQDYTHFNREDIIKVSEKLPSILDYLEENEFNLETHQLDYIVDYYTELLDRFDAKKVEILAPAP